MKTIIVGGGVMGLATAWGLAREGHRVELFEQAELPNPLASSVDEHRLIRHPYGDREGYARMIDPAFAAWDLLWRDLGETLYAATGTLALTGNGADWAERSANTLAAIGRPMTELTLDALRQRFPQLDARGVESAFWIDTGGVLFAQDIVAALVRHLANRPTVRLHPRTPVRSVNLEQGRIVTDSGTTHDAEIQPPPLLNSTMSSGPRRSHWSRRRSFWKVICGSKKRLNLVLRIRFRAITPIDCFSAESTGSTLNSPWRVSRGRFSKISIL